MTRSRNGVGAFSSMVLITTVISTATIMLSACSSDVPARRDTTPTGSSKPTAGTLETSTTEVEAAGIAACTSSTSRPSLDPPAQPPAGGQVTLTLRYTNIAETPCATTGYPGATLTGPPHPNLGNEFVLQRSTIRGPVSLVLAPGESAIADLTVLTVSPGTDGAWLPTQLLTTAPDDTVAVALPWPPTMTVLRQDGATHPGSYIGALHLAS